MKNIIYILILFLAISSCKKEEEIEYSTSKIMTAKLEGNLWRAVEPTGSSAYGLYHISGESKIGHKIDLYLNSVSVGIHSLSAASESKAEYTMASDGGVFTTQNGAGTSGYIEIQDVNISSNSVTGKFYFVANQIGTHYTKTISDGKFENIEYAYLPPSASDNMLTASISGSPYIASTVMGNLNNGKVTVLGAEGSKYIYVTVPVTSTPGTYSLDGLMYSISYSNNPDNYIADNGSITITEHNTSTKQIKGTFSLTAHNSNDVTDIVTITNGKFVSIY